MSPTHIKAATNLQRYTSPRRSNPPGLLFSSSTPRDLTRHRWTTPSSHSSAAPSTRPRGHPHPRRAAPRLLRLLGPLPDQARAARPRPRRGRTARRLREVSQLPCRRAARTAANDARTDLALSAPHRSLSASGSHATLSSGDVACGTGFAFAGRASSGSWLSPRCSARPRIGRRADAARRTCRGTTSTSPSTPTKHTARAPRARHLDEHAPSRPSNHVAFNFYPHYRVPQGDYLLLAKTLEMLRLQPSLGIDRGGRHGVIKEAQLARARRASRPTRCCRSSSTTTTPPRSRSRCRSRSSPASRSRSNSSASSTCRTSRAGWGHWEGVTYLTNALPLLAFCDDTGWQPMPFVPWHQPWFNEAGVFTATITLPDERECSPAPAAIEVGNESRRRPEARRDASRSSAATSRCCARARYKEFTTRDEAARRQDGRRSAASRSPSTSSTRPRS